MPSWQVSREGEDGKFRLLSEFCFSQTKRLAIAQPNFPFKKGNTNSKQFPSRTRRMDVAPIRVRISIPYNQNHQTFLFEPSNPSIARNPRGGKRSPQVLFVCAYIFSYTLLLLTVNLVIDLANLLLKDIIYSLSPVEVQQGAPFVPSRHSRGKKILFVNKFMKPFR